MMTGFLIAAAVVVYVVALGWLVVRAVDSDRPLRWVVTACVWVVMGFGLVINGINASEQEAQGPCIREATGYAYVNRVMVPYTYCAERGTWVK